jgi:hypothetical protein
MNGPAAHAAAVAPAVNNSGRSCRLCAGGRHLLVADTAMIITATWIMMFRCCAMHWQRYRAAGYLEAIITAILRRIFVCGVRRCSCCCVWRIISLRLLWTVSRTLCGFACCCISIAVDRPRHDCQRVMSRLCPWPVHDVIEPPRAQERRHRCCAGVAGVQMAKISDRVDTPALHLNSHQRPSSCTHTRWQMPSCSCRPQDCMHVYIRSLVLICSF